MILFESFLSSSASVCRSRWRAWAVLINDGAQEMQSAPWMLLVPLVLVVLLLCFKPDG